MKDLERPRTSRPFEGEPTGMSLGVMSSLREGDGGFLDQSIHFVRNGDRNQGCGELVEATNGFQGATSNAAALVEEFEVEGETLDALSQDEEADIENVLEADGRIEGAGGADAGPTDDIAVGEFVDDTETQATEVGVLAFLHVAVVTGEMDDTGHVGVGKFDAAFCGELRDRFGGHRGKRHY